MANRISEQYRSGPEYSGDDSDTLELPDTDREGSYESVGEYTDALLAYLRALENASLTEAQGAAYHLNCMRKDYNLNYEKIGIILADNDLLESDEPEVLREQVKQLVLEARIAIIKAMKEGEGWTPFDPRSN